jgi:signal peptidase I
VIEMHEHRIQVSQLHALAASPFSSSGSSGVDYKQLQEAEDAAGDFLTKGDNNAVDDRNLYAPGQRWLRRSEMIGKAVASVPYMGMVTIFLNDYPYLKFVLIGLMGFLVLTGKET